MLQRSILKLHAPSLFLVVVVVSLSGCGGATDPFTYVKESGKITFTDGTPIPAFRTQLIFVSEVPPSDPKYSPPNGIAEVKADGTYDMIRSQTHDGIVPGKHKVIIRCMDNKDHRLMNLVASEYNEVRTTTLEADTNDPASFNFSIKKYAGPPPGARYPGMQGQPGVQSGRR